MLQQITHNIIITKKFEGKRLDFALASLFPQYSRARIKHWIENKYITVNSNFLRAKDKVKGGETVVINAILESEIEHKPENIKLDIVYEDNDIIIINKKAGLVVHPACGNRSGTLLNALLCHDPNLNKLPRAGIIHRLDKDTSGLMVVAKNICSYNYLVKQMQERKISREYEAIVCGVLISGGIVDANIGRHPHKRTHMAVIENGKEAITHYRVIKRFHSHTHIKVKLETGRTHQIRVHMAHIHHPLVGDQTYDRMRLPKGASQELIDVLKNFKRQALHAIELGLEHPSTKKWMSFKTELPEDMKELLKNCNYSAGDIELR